jgi:hypothetical protein
MKTLTATEARRWCSQAEVIMTRDSTLRYKNAAEYKFFITAPEEHREIVFLARAMVTFRGEVDFCGGLLWLQRWDIGSPQLVRVGWRILEGIRRAHGELHSLEAAPAQLFRDDELVELHAFLIQVIAFGWVSDFIPSAGGFFLHFKDNLQICVTAKSPETLKELRTYFQQWHPTDEDPMVLKLKSFEKTVGKGGRVAHSLRRL